MSSRLTAYVLLSHWPTSHHHAHPSQPLHAPAQCNPGLIHVIPPFDLVQWHPPALACCRHAQYCPVRHSACGCATLCFTYGEHTVITESASFNSRRPSCDALELNSPPGGHHTARTRCGQARKHPCPNFVRLDTWSSSRTGPTCHADR